MSIVIAQTAPTAVALKERGETGVSLVSVIAEPKEGERAGIRVTSLATGVSILSTDEAVLLADAILRIVE